MTLNVTESIYGTEVKTPSELERKGVFFYGGIYENETHITFDSRYKTISILKGGTYILGREKAVNGIGITLNNVRVGKFTESWDEDSALLVKRFIHMKLKQGE